MAAHNMDAVLVTTEANHRYFTGHETHRWTHKYTGIFALLPWRASRSSSSRPKKPTCAPRTPWVETIRTFPVHHVLQGIEAIAATIRQLGLEQSRIGSELGGMVWMRLPFADFGHLQDDLPGVEFVDAAPLMWQMRARKSRAEVDLIRPGRGHHRPGL